MTDQVTLNAEDFYHALDHIRLACLSHYLGGAFDPDHMRDLANFASAVMAGRSVTAIDYEAVSRDAHEMAERMREFVE